MTALLGLETRLRLARLLLVTDARPGGGELTGFARDAFAGGVDILQLADPALDARGSLRSLEALRDEALKRQRLVAVTADADLAGEFGADLLVLLDDASVAREARRRLHRYALIGRSCRSRGDIDTALADADVNFLIVNADLDTVRHAAEKAPQDVVGAKPWFAAGGVTAASVPALAALGCRRVAVSRAVTGAADPRAAASGLAAALKAAWAADPAMEAVEFAAFGAGRAVITDPFPDAPGAPAGGPKLPDGGQR